MNINYKDKGEDSESEKELMIKLAENIVNGKLNDSKELIKSLLETKKVFKLDIGKGFVYEYSKNDDFYMIKKYENECLFEEVFYNKEGVVLKVIVYIDIEPNGIEIHSIKYFENGKPTIKENYFENELNQITIYNQETGLYKKETVYSDYKRKIVWSETDYDSINGYRIQHIEYFEDTEIIDYIFKYHQNKKNKISYYMEYKTNGEPKKFKSFIKFLLYKIKNW